MEYQALLPVCMKYPARVESHITNIAQGKASAIFVSRLFPRVKYFMQRSYSYCVLLYFTLKEMLTKYTSLKFITPSTYLFNKQMFFFDEMC